MEFIISPKTYALLEGDPCVVVGATAGLSNSHETLF